MGLPPVDPGVGRPGPATNTTEIDANRSAAFRSRGFEVAFTGTRSTVARKESSLGRRPIKRWPVRLVAIKLPMDRVFVLFSCFILTTRRHCLSPGKGGYGAFIGATTDMHQTYQSNIHKMGGMPVESIASL